ncbi:MAG: hypothetical protein ACRDQY_21650, partial [Pseudonocardiaceae bacterium]
RTQRRNPRQGHSQRVRSPSKTTPAPVDFRASHSRLRKTLRDAMRASGDLSSVEYRASAALDALLSAHLVNPQGRCESCRCPGKLPGLRRPPCRIYVTALYWRRHVR